MRVLGQIYKNETFDLAHTDNLSSSGTHTNEDAEESLLNLKLVSQKLRDTIFFIPASDKFETGCNDFGRKFEYITQ